jgi:hypothetical protein
VCGTALPRFSSADRCVYGTRRRSRSEFPSYGVGDPTQVAKSGAILDIDEGHTSLGDEERLIRASLMVSLALMRYAWHVGALPRSQPIRR